MVALSETERLTHRAWSEIDFVIGERRESGLGRAPWCQSSLGLSPLIVAAGAAKTTPGNEGQRCHARKQKEVSKQPMEKAKKQPENQPDASRGDVTRSNLAYLEFFSVVFPIACGSIASCIYTFQACFQRFLTIFLSLPSTLYEAEILYHKA